MENAEKSFNNVGGVLEENIIKAGKKFVEKIEQITKLPDLDFHSNSTVFVCIPSYKELENIERLFNSWNSQELPDEVNIEIIICRIFMKKIKRKISDFIS